jgi:hypothetical protein
MRRGLREWCWAGGGGDDLCTLPASRLLLSDLELPRPRASPPRACSSEAQNRRGVAPLLLDLEGWRRIRCRKAGGANLARRRSGSRSIAGWSSVKGCWTRKGGAPLPPGAARRLPASPSSRYPFPSSRLQTHGGSHQIDWSSHQNDFFFEILTVPQNDWKYYLIVNKKQSAGMLICY